MDEEIKYIPYGTDEIDYNQFITNSANEVQSYINQQPWSNKRKESFLRAYQDLISKGITGASNTSGIWKINYGKEAIPLETLSKRDREMYGEAAYFLQQQMSRIPTKSSLAKETENKKSELPLFDNKYFTSHFEDHISKLFGGRNWSQSEWNDQDERGENGLRGTDIRKQKLAERLQTYSDSLKEEELNFENSPFENLADFKSKVAGAIEALKGNDEKLIKDRLNLIGLKYEDYFSNGSEDPVTLTDGTTTTYGQYAKYQDALNAKKELEDKKKAEALIAANAGVLSTSVGNRPVEALNNAENYNKWLIQTYGSGQQGFNKINQRIQSLLEKSYNQGRSNGLNQAEKKELGNLIHYIRTNNPKYQNYNLTPEEEGELSKHNSMKGRILQDFVRLPWQTDGRYIYADKSGNIYFLKPQNKKQLQQQTFTKSQAYNNYIKNFGKTSLQINNEQAEKLRNEDAQRTEINENDILYLSSLVPDIASLFDEEPISAGALGVSAAGIRNAALANRPGGMSLEDKLWQGLDYVGGAFSSVPFFGDAYVLGRILNTARKGATALLAMAGAVGVSRDVYNLVEKFNNDETLTAKEKVALVSSIPLIINAYRSGRVWKQNKTIKAINEGEKTKQGTIEATNGSIKGVKEETTKALQKEFKKAGNDNAKKQEILKNNEEVIKLAKEQNVKIEDLQFESRLRNGKRSPFKKQQDIKLEDVSTGNPVYRQNYQNYLKELEQGNFWQRNKARGLKEADWFYNATGGSRNTSNKGNWFTRTWNDTFGRNKTYDRIVNSSETPISKPSTETPKTTETPKPKSIEISKQSKERIKKYNEFVDKRIKDLNEGKFSKNKLKSGDLDISGNRLQVVEQSDGTFNLIYKGNIQGNFQKHEQKKLQEAIREIINNRTIRIDPNTKVKTIGTKEMGKVLQELKRKGWLKQGGTINNLDIEIKEILKTL